MTRLGLRAYRAGDSPTLGSVPVSVIVLTRNEAPNIARCLASVAWADQVVVVDSGSTDDTVPIARRHGALVVEQPWLGFARQREFALRASSIAHDWVYFVDADEWVSPELAQEIEMVLHAPNCAAFSQRLRLMFERAWIRHCGWYGGSWVVRLMDRRYAHFNRATIGERSQVGGRIRRLTNDIVDDDQKGTASWLRKHVRYAELEAARRSRPTGVVQGIRAVLATRGTDSRPMTRALLKEVVFPALPAKPAALFVYMYVLRLGVLDGRAGLRFCFFHAWFEVAVAASQADISRTEYRTTV